ncbi:hypothetical protein BDR06DRAFT_886491, partial [Suillus hirtellus]
MDVNARASLHPAINLGPVTSYKIEALNDINWITWKERIETILNLHGVYGHIDGTCKRPTTDKDEIAYWDKQDYVARTLILNNIKDDKVVHVSRAKTIKEAWENLKTIHETRSQSSAL